jgi:hypothetical protein
MLWTSVKVSNSGLSYGEWSAQYLWALGDWGLGIGDARNTG